MSVDTVNEKYVTMAQEVSDRLIGFIQTNEDEQWVCKVEIENWKHRYARVCEMKQSIPKDNKEIQQLLEVANFQLEKWKNKKSNLENERVTLNSLSHRAKIFNQSFEVTSITRTLAVMSGMDEVQGSSIVDPAKEMESLRRTVFELEGYSEIL